MFPLAGLPELRPADAVGLVWAAAVTAALIALRGRLGLAEAVSGSLAAWTTALLLWIPPQPAAQAKLLVGLAFIALATGRLLRDRDPSAARAAWALCWLLATATAARDLASMVFGPDRDPRGPRLVAVALGALWASAPRTASGPLAWYAGGAYATMLLRWGFQEAGYPTNLPAGALAFAAAALLGLLADLIIRWDKRRRAWEREPWHAPGPIAPPKRLYAGLVAVALLAAVLAAIGRIDALAVAAAFFAALVCYVAGHVCGWRHAGVLGLILSGETIVLLTTAIIGADASGLAFGSILAAGWLLWIARFWEQQLLDGRPWTTAGRLIAPARTLARLATLLVAAAAGWAYVCGVPPTLPESISLTLLLALLARIFLRDARTPAYADSAWAGLLLVATLVLPLRAAMRDVAVLGDVPLAVWLAVLGVLLALPGSLRGLTATRCAIGCALPAAMITCALHARDGGSIIAAALALAAGLLVMVRR